MCIFTPFEACSRIMSWLNKRSWSVSYCEKDDLLRRGMIDWNPLVCRCEIGSVQNSSYTDRYAAIIFWLMFHAMSMCNIYHVFVVCRPTTWYTCLEKTSLFRSAQRMQTSWISKSSGWSTASEVAYCRLFDTLYATLHVYTHYALKYSAHIRN
jgi:hypothetical protein